VGRNRGSAGETCAHQVGLKRVASRNSYGKD
jgi:hypothetical protein